MSLKNKVIKDMFKMSSAAAQQGSTKAPSHKLSCWTQPNPWVNPTHRQLWTILYLYVYELCTQMRLTTVFTE